MRLQRQISRRIEEAEYAKYVVIIPPDRIDKLGWKEGQELESQVQGQKLIIGLKPRNQEKKESR
jgi:antitoxin component of MazEF toxin-antitoxin module